MAAYSELNGIILDWANRESDVLSSSVVTRCLDWAADECYRRLRVPPLELSRTITLTESQVVDNTRLGGHVATFPVPSDYIELIYLYKQGPASAREDLVYNYRLDNRALLDSYSEAKYNSFTRIGNNFQIFGDVDEGDTITVHYYRRLPALNATYSVVASNWTNGTGLADQPYLAAPDASNPSQGQLRIDSDNNVVATGGTLTNLRGKEASHWLRDENERILIFGALMEVFQYLNEPDQYQAYSSRFYQEIEELNAQEKRRDAMGGTIQTSYNGGGLL